MARESLEDLLKRVGGPVKLLRNSQTGPYVYPVVPAEFTNWRDEQRAWQQTCVLFNQSYHMAELAVQGPDALRLLSGLGVNSFANFAPGKAKQFVPVTPEGYVIGDVILFGLGEQEFNLVGRAPVLNWVMYHAQTGDYDVTTEFDQRTALRTDGRRKHYRFQVQGPNANGCPPTATRARRRWAAASPRRTSRTTTSRPGTSATGTSSSSTTTSSGARRSSGWRAGRIARRSR